MDRFRRGMETVLSDIRSHAPNALVVFPGLPVQTNVFPLGLAVDAALSVWEAIKKKVATRTNAVYLEVSPEDMTDLYGNAFRSPSNTSPVDEHGMSILDDLNATGSEPHLSPDGVHPNRKMYEKWAQMVGNKLYSRICQLREKTKHDANEGADQSSSA